MNKEKKTIGAFYTLSEEVANSVTHGVGLLLAVAGLVILTVFAAMKGTAWHVVSFSLFGSALVILYLISTLYHSISHPKVKAFFQRLDHSVIFILIAGSYTPFLLVSIRGPWGWSVFGVVWGLAIAGILLKALYFNKFQKTALILYVSMGWMIVIVFGQVMKNVPFISLVFLFIGGIVYTAGVIFFVWEKLPYSHAIWHLFVLTGSIMHFFAVLNIL